MQVYSINRRNCTCVYCIYIYYALSNAGVRSGRHEIRHTIVVALLPGRRFSQRREIDLSSLPTRRLGDTWILQKKISRRILDESDLTCASSLREMYLYSYLSLTFETKLTMEDAILFVVAIELRFSFSSYVFLTLVTHACFSSCGFPSRLNPLFFRIAFRYIPYGLQQRAPSSLSLSLSLSCNYVVVNSRLKSLKRVILLTQYLGTTQSVQ